MLNLRLGLDPLLLLLHFELSLDLLDVDPLERYEKEMLRFSELGVVGGFPEECLEGMNAYFHKIEDLCSKSVTAYNVQEESLLEILHVHSRHM